MKLIKIDQGLQFSDGTEVTDHHNQDCCENVYADWNQLEDTDIMSKTFRKIKIEGVKGSGFRINGYFVPCYNEQNGYYGSDLSLEITTAGKDKQIIDISEFVEDRIN